MEMARIFFFFFFFHEVERHEYFPGDTSLATNYEQKKVKLH